MKNVQVNSDGLQFDNANGTHTNVNTSASADTYINLPASSGTLALVSDVTAATGGAVISAELVTPEALVDDTLQTIITLPEIPTSGVYEMDYVAYATTSADYADSPNGLIHITNTVRTVNSRMMRTDDGVNAFSGVTFSNDTANMSTYNFYVTTNGALYDANYPAAALTQKQRAYFAAGEVLVVKMQHDMGGIEYVGTITVQECYLRLKLIHAMTL